MAEQTTGTAPDEKTGEKTGEKAGKKSGEKSDRSPELDDLTQATYQETPWEDSSWELVGQFHNQTTFEPMAFTVLEGDVSVSDPMFADYGGILDPDIRKRFHSPTGIGPDSRYIEGPVPVEAAEDLVRMREEEFAQQLAAAREEGRQAALTESATIRAAELQAVEGRVNAVFQDLAAQLKERITTIEREAVDLTLNITNRLVHETVEINPEYLVPIIRAAVEHAGGASIMTVRVSPQDAEFFKIMDPVKVMKEFDGSWKFEADDTIRAGCVLETSAGEVDFDLDKAFQRIKDSILKVL